MSKDCLSPRFGELRGLVFVPRSPYAILPPERGEMSLDLNQAAAQIDAMAANLELEEADWRARLDRALGTLREQSAGLDELKRRIAESRTTWLIAGITDDPGGSHGPPPCPDEFAVVATDGSHIDVDRHGPARCYLINIGSAALAYGGRPDAILRSRPTLYSGKEDMTIINPLGGTEQPIDGGLLGIKRQVAECSALAELVEEAAPDRPVLSLVDGTLVMWGLAGHTYPDFVRTELLQNGFLLALDNIRDAGPGAGVALASYISLPRSTEVANVLRLAVCPHDPPNCDQHCARLPQSAGRECDAVGVRDRDLFHVLLKPGERSSVFVSGSSVVQEYYGGHEVRFFYLKAGDEIARVEFPRWVEDRGLVGLVHALVLDQCERGQGYPVALSEAHEQAVLTGADREQFRLLVERALSDRKLPVVVSEKSRSKRTRWV